MHRLNVKYLLVGGCIMLIAGVIVFAASGMFQSIDHSILTQEYLLRGESNIDSSIVVLYLDNDAIASLGDLPLKRNYYALIVHALHDLGAKAIGIDIAFTEPEKEYPEYDTLFSSVVRDAGNVVFSGYFNSLTERTPPGFSIPERFTYSNQTHLPFLYGSRLKLPFDELLLSAYGIGHTNLTDDLRIPSFISISDSGPDNLIASFPLEVWRASARLDRNRIHCSSSGIRIETGSADLSVPYSGQGEVMVNYAGGNASLQMYPLVNVLQSYDKMMNGEEANFPIKSISGKIVLVGIVAQGRGTFIETPFSSQFPLIGVHATFLHNLLHQNFLKPVEIWVGYCLSMLISIVVIFSMLFRREVTTLLIVFLCMFGIALLSFLAFSSAGYVIPISHILFMIISVYVGLLVYKHQVVKTEVGRVTQEKDRIEAILHNKELTLRSLESELALSKNERSTSLLEEIRKYKAEITRLQIESSDLQPFIPPQGGKNVENFSGIIYAPSGPMGEVMKFVRKIADSDASVLLLGESGTGKELVAQALHAHSRRYEKPFVAVNCGALSETLLESELFGHEKGAFTGAIKDRPGRFELADGGTIFLDEIAETSEAFQVKLLRVVQEGTFERVGGTVSQKVNVRIVAATNRDVKKMVQEKKFREDLYYRLNVFTVQLPALKERPLDIPLLVERFIATESEGMECSASVMNIIQQYSWPGNVRELQSVVKRAVLLARADERSILRVKDLPVDVASSARESIDLEEHVIESLQDKKFSHSAISETADELGGLNRGTVAEYLRGYCFKMFLEHDCDVKNAVISISGSAEKTVQEKVEKKLIEYLRNAVEFADPSKNIEFILEASRPKYKNLPQRYHPILDEILRRYHRGEWVIQ